MDHLEKMISVRVFDEVLEEARANVMAHSDTYENMSHYVRVALMRLNAHHRGVLDHELEDQENL